MKRSTLLVTILVVAVLAAAYWYWSSRPEPGLVLDLVEGFRGAEKRANAEINAVFALEPQTIKGETRPAIYMHPTSRVIYSDVKIPPNARIRAWLGIREEAWDKGTDGVYFRIGVSANNVFADVITRHVDPFHKPEDRGWVAVEADLSAYANQTVSVILNTNTSPPNMGDHNMYDFAVIGSPVIYVPQAP